MKKETPYVPALSNGWLDCEYRLKQAFASGDGTEFYRNLSILSEMHRTLGAQNHANVVAYFNATRPTAIDKAFDALGVFVASLIGSLMLWSANIADARRESLREMARYSFALGILMVMSCAGVLMGFEALVGGY